MLYSNCDNTSVTIYNSNLFTLRNLKNWDAFCECNQTAFAHFAIEKSIKMICHNVIRKYNLLLA